MTTPLIISPKEMLLDYQRAFNDDRSRFKIGVFSRQTGKSTVTAHEVAEESFTTPESLWICMSAGERQASEWQRKLQDWAECYRLAIEDYAEDRESGEALMQKAVTTFANGSRVISIPANPATARGYSGNFLLDEFDYHEDQAAVWRAVYPSITNPLGGSLYSRFRALRDGRKTETVTRRMVIVTTYNGKRMAYKLMHDSAWSGHKVTIEDAVAAGLQVDLDALRAGLDDPDAWAQEYMCEPLDGSNVLLPYELIAQAESADATEFGDPGQWGAGGEYYCGIDFGRQNDPSVCWTLERVGDVLWTREVLVLNRASTPEQVEVFGPRIAKAQAVCLDYTGPGIGLGDYLVQEHGELKPALHQWGKVELCTFTVALKRLIFPRLRRGFEAPTEVRVPISRDIREDLHAMYQEVKNGQYNYWAPRTRDGHSDRCTALALAVRAAGDGEGAIPGVALCG